MAKLCTTCAGALQLSDEPLALKSWGAEAAVPSGKRTTSERQRYGIGEWLPSGYEYASLDGLGDA
jgi:hypothetical protein